MMFKHQVGTLILGVMISFSSLGNGLFENLEYPDNKNRAERA